MTSVEHKNSATKVMTVKHLAAHMRAKPERKTHVYHNLMRDMIIVIGSLIAAALLLKFGILDRIISLTDGIEYLGSFIAGIFFTSLFTIAPAAVALGGLAQHISPFEVAFFGAAGAMIGDLVIYLFLKDGLEEDIMEAIRTTRFHNILSLSRHGLARWVLPLIGAMAIASPLPDEIGLALMGAARMRTLYVLPITFFMNYLGVLMIASLGGVL